jgi:Protein of unknown function (DUF2510)
MNLESTIVAGWYHDPAGSDQLRWWDGAVWTTHLSPAQPTSSVAAETDPTTTTTDSSVGLSRREIRERQTADALTQGAAGESDAEPAAQAHAQPTFTTPSTAPPVPLPPAPLDAPWVVGGAPTASSTTAAAWGLALLPLMPLVIIWIIVDVMGFASYLPLRYVLIIAPVLIGLALARRDRAALTDRGFTHLPAAGWALFPLVYFILRWKVTGRGAWPLFTWLPIQSVAVVFIALHLAATAQLLGIPTAGFVSDQPVATEAELAPLTVDERSYLLTVDGMQRSLDYAIVGDSGGTAGTVCPALPTTDEGASVTCTATDGDSHMSIVIVVTNSDPLYAYDIASVLYE